MEALAIVVMLLALLALAGVVTFFLWDYYKHKDENEKTFLETKQRVETEKKDRLGNIKFVVDQVNEVNQDIYKEITTNVGDIRSSNVVFQKTQSELLGGLDKFLRFSSNQTIGGAPLPVSLMNLPGTTSPNVELIQNVTAVMGLTAVDLGEGAKSVKFCGKDKSRCIEFPNTNGDVFITSLKPGSNVVIDAPTRVQGSLEISGTRFVPDTNTTNLSIQTPGNIGIGGTGFSAPGAKFHVSGLENGQGDIFKVSAASSDAILVQANGDIVAKKPILFKTTDGMEVASVRVKSDVGAAPVLQLQSSTELQLDADVLVTKKLTVKDLQVSGTGKIGTQNIATQNAA